MACYYFPGICDFPLQLTCTPQRACAYVTAQYQSALGDLEKEMQVVTASANPWARSLHLKVVFCSVYANSRLPSLVLVYCSKMDMLMHEIVGLRCCSKNRSKTISSAYAVSNSCVCARVDMENRRREEFGVAVAHFFSFSSVFPLSLRCCQSPWGRISAAAIGRPRLSKYAF